MQLFCLILMILLILYICKTLSNTNKDNIVGGNINTLSPIDESDLLDEIINKRLNKNISNGGEINNFSSNILELIMVCSMSEISMRFTI